MPYGAPDYSNVQKKQGRQVLADMAELAVRLGSPYVYHRGGDVVFMETFEHGIERWTVITSGDGAGVERDHDYYDSMGYSCKLTAGDDDDTLASIQHAVAVEPTGGVGFTVALAPDGFTEYLDLNLYYHDGDCVWTAWVYYDRIDGHIHLVDGLGNYPLIIEDVSLIITTGSFCYVKLVVDLENKTYLRLFVNEHAVDISEYTLDRDDSQAAPQINMMVTNVGLADANGVLYVDTVILTVNEY